MATALETNRSPRFPGSAPIAVDDTLSPYQANRQHRTVLRAASARYGGWAVENLYGGEWADLPWRAAAGCARSILSDDGTVGVRCGEADDGSVRAYFSGVRKCGSVWLCPVCTTTIRAHRAQEVGLIAAAHTAAGGTLSMATFTVRHTRAMSLETVYGALRGAFTSFQQSAAWRRFREDMTGTTVSVEVTEGDNGWHCHLHVLLLWQPGDSDGVRRRRLRSLKRFAPRAWAERVERKLGLRPSDRRGFHVTNIDASAAKYVSKIAAEVTRGDYKSRDALDVLLNGVLAGDSAACARFAEWATVMPGKRMIRFSPGLRELYLPTTPELSDTEAANVDLQQAPLLGELAREDYLALMVATRAKPIPGSSRFLVTVERTGWHPILRAPRKAEGAPPAANVWERVRLARRLGVNSGGPPTITKAWERSTVVADLLARCGVRVE